MRRPATWLAVGVVLVVGVAAAADALRQKASEPEAASTTTAPAGTTTRASPATGLSGVLYYTDEECRLAAVQFPDVEPVDAAEWNECGFSLSPDGRRLAGEGFVWHPGGSVRASQGDGSIVVALQQGTSESLYTFLGSGPSFSPEALLTFALGTEIRAMDAGCPLSRSNAPVIPEGAIRGCSSVVVPREAIERAARRHPSADVAPGLLTVSVRETAWLGAQEAPARLAALLRLRVRNGEEFDLIALFEGGEIAADIASFEGLSGLEASPGGSYFGVLTKTRGEVLLFDRETRSLPVRQIGRIRAFEWSPDEDWIALATPAAVYIDLTERRQFNEPPQLRRLRIVARDLAWRDVFVSL